MATVGLVARYAHRLVYIDITAFNRKSLWTQLDCCWTWTCCSTPWSQEEWHRRRSLPRYLCSFPCCCWHHRLRWSCFRSRLSWLQNVWATFVNSKFVAYSSHSSRRLLLRWQWACCPNYLLPLLRSVRTEFLCSFKASYEWLFCS